MADEVTFQENAVIYFHGDPSGVIYMLRAGNVELTYEVADTTARHIGPGELLGLADSLGGYPRIETARAVSDVTAMRVSIEELRVMLANNVQIGLKVVTSLCAELRLLDEMIVGRMRGGHPGTGGVAEGLRMIADHFRDKGLPRAARYAYAKLVESTLDPDVALDAALQVGTMCEKEAEIQTALEVYQTLEAKYPSDPRPKLALARVRKVMDTFGDRL